MSNGPTLALVAALTTVGPILAQSQFEVATIRPTIPDKPSGYALNCSSGGGFVAREQTLLSLLQFAYDVPRIDDRIVGGPAWMRSQQTRFEVHGKVPQKVTLEECRHMLESLLADRFQVALHHETRELSVYLLSVSKKGHKLQETGENPGVLSSVTLNGSPVQIGNGFHTTASGRGMSMEELARLLTQLPAVGRTVIDKTGINGFYGFSLDYAQSFGDDTHPDIFAALQEQLGLRLESTKAPVDVIVVDHAEQPSEN